MDNYATILDVSGEFVSHLLHDVYIYLYCKADNHMSCTLESFNTVLPEGLNIGTV